jgi:hypothetical protein
MQDSMSALSDLEIYQRLNAMADELDQLAKRGVSLIGGTALNTAGRTLRGMAKAVYEHSLGVADDSLPQ